MSTIETIRNSEQKLENLAKLEDNKLQPLPDFADYVKAYARQKPEVAALWCFGVGFVLGWKLKPW